MNCGLCDDGEPERAVVQVDCVTDDGEATVYCCANHMVDGYAAAVILSDHAPVIKILNGGDLSTIRCPPMQFADDYQTSALKEKVMVQAIVPSDITRSLQAPRKLLHVGCGRSGRENTHHQFHGPEWEHVRFDIDPTVQPDVCGDMRMLDAIEDESVDAIFSSHNLEHLHWNDVFVTLKSFLRVLKDRGRLVVVVPDFEVACEQVVRGEGLEMLYMSPAGPITALDMIFGYRPMTYDNPFMQHRTGFTDKWLKNVLVDQGFSSVEVVTTEGYDIWAFARKLV